MKQTAAAILHDDDLAADAVQDTVVQLWSHRWRLGLVKDKRGFCFKALKNRCIDILRQQQRIRRHQTCLEYEYQTFSEETDSILEERYQILEKTISALPPQQRRLIEMKYIEQHSIREISQLTDLSETNIRTILSRAYATIREALQTSYNTQ